MIIPKEKCKELSDLEVIRKALEEVDYFSCLYDRYEAQLLRYIRRLTLLSSEEAEDILQESFIKIWKNLHGFDQSLKLSSWIYRIVHNQAISCLRQKKSFGKDQKVSINEAIFAVSEDESAGVSEAEALHQDTLLQSVLNQLPLPYKEVLVLKFLENMSYAEISDVLKIPEGTVATRINRAKKAFAALTAAQNLVFDL